MRSSLVLSIAVLVFVAACDVADARVYRRRGGGCSAVAQSEPKSESQQFVDTGRRVDPLRQRQEAAFQHALELYRAHPDLHEWRARVTIDRQLSKGAGGLPESRLTELLHASSNDLAVATAVAVCLGDAPADDPTKQTVKLFEELLASPYERVRYRAAESIVQRLAEGTIDQAASELLLPVVDSAIAGEALEMNRQSLYFAKHRLTDPAPIRLGK